MQLYPENRFIVMFNTYKFAEGITGQSLYATVFAHKGEGWKKTGYGIKTKELKNKFKSTAKEYGDYGSNYNFKTMKGKDLIKIPNWYITKLKIDA